MLVTSLQTSQGTLFLHSLFCSFSHSADSDFSHGQRRGMNLKRGNKNPGWLGYMLHCDIALYDFMGMRSTSPMGFRDFFSQ